MKKYVLSFLWLSLTLITGPANSVVINFDMTGRLTVLVTGSSGPDFLDIFVDETGGNRPNGQTFGALSAVLSYDTVSGIGSSGLTVAAAGFVFHDMTMTRQAGTNLITGSLFFDAPGEFTFNNPANVEWDATGFFDAINFGLAVGDVISGSVLYRDANNNGTQDAGEFLTNIGSVTPYSDTLQQGYSGPAYSSLAGPTPIAATSDSTGAANGDGIGYFDLGNGNSLKVNSITPSPVPVPAAVWLFGSGLLSLIGIARHRKILPI